MRERERERERDKRERERERERLTKAGPVPRPSSTWYRAFRMFATVKQNSGVGVH